MLIALFAFLVVHQTQAKKAPRVSWISPTAFSPKPLKLASYKEIDENRAGTINSVDGSGGEGCGMSPEEFAKFYPPLVAWIRNTLAASAPVAQTVASRGFSRLPLYFTEKTLASAKVVFVEPLPIPPLRSIFPRDWCEQNNIPRKDYDSIVNKTPISYKANRMIGGVAPSKYLLRLQQHKQVQLDNESMDRILVSHLIPPDSLRADDFHGFYDKRKASLLTLITSVMGKEPLPTTNAEDVYEETDENEGPRVAAE